MNLSRGDLAGIVEYLLETDTYADRVNRTRSQTELRVTLRKILAYEAPDLLKTLNEAINRKYANPH